MDYNNILVVTVEEFINTLYELTERSSILKISRGWKLLGSSFFLPDLIKNVEQMSKGESGQLFQKEDDLFFKQDFEFFDTLEIQEWWPDLEEDEKKIVWKYLKTLKYLVNKL